MGRKSKDGPTTSAIPGVYFRKDGKPRWYVKIRWTENGQNKQLPTVYYPVDLNAKEGDDRHIAQAKSYAQQHAIRQWANVKSSIVDWGLAGHNYNLRQVLERYIQEFEDGLIVEKGIGTFVHGKNKEVAGLAKHVLTARVVLGHAKTGHNKDGFPDLTSKALTALRYEDFFSKDPKSFSSQLKDRRGGVAGAGSIRKHVAALKKIMDFAIDVWKIDFENPITTLKDIGASVERERIVTDEEFSAITSQMRSGRTDEHNILAIEFAKVTAVRREEACSVMWNDTSLKSKTCLLRDTKSVDGTYRERVVPLNKRAIEIIETVLGGQPIEQMTGTLFKARNGGPIRPDSLTQAWGRARAAVAKQRNDPGILSARVHDLRHTRITELGSFMTYQEVMRISGHKDFQAFIRYFNPRAEDMGRKIDAHEAGRDIDLVTSKEITDLLVGLPSEDWIKLLSTVSTLRENRK